MSTNTSTAVVDPAETVYMDESRAMSTDIQALADSVYKEFEKVIRDYDENAVKDLMPLIVSILESLDKAVQDKQDYEVDLEMVREDNEQLMTQYEREKQLRKNYEQKYLAFEDSAEEERKMLQGKIESLESIIRLFEIKMKNAQDQISRFEEREAENKKEYNKLHDRYTDLFKAHFDYREKMKFVASDKISVDTLPNRRVVSHTPIFADPVLTLSAANNADWFPSRVAVSGLAVPSKSHSAVGVGENVSFEEESKRIAKQERAGREKGNSRETRETDTNTDDVNVQERGTGTSRATTEASTLGDYDSAAFESEFRESFEAKIDASIISNRYRDALSGDFPSLRTAECDETEEYSDTSRSRSMVSVFDELSSQDMDALGQIDDGADIAGVSREVENLIQENNELLATKNALNVVKDDLIAKVDQLTSEKEIFQEEVHSLEVVRDKLKTRIVELEDEIKKLRDAFEQEKNKASLVNEDDEDSIPMAQRKRFTRLEMARVLLERNQYKERLMELQEAVRWTEMIRATARDSDRMNKKTTTLWTFFSNLFTAPSKPPKKTTTLPTVKYNSPNTAVKPVVDHQGSSHPHGPKAKAFDFLKDDFISAHEQSTFYVPATDASAVLTEKTRKAREHERREQQKQATALMKCDDGRLQAYGWSLPAKFPAHTITDAAALKSQQIPIPVPVYCRPIMEDETTTKLWCAAAVNVTGGRTRDGGSVVGASVFYSSSSRLAKSSVAVDEVEKLNQEIEVHEKDVKSTETNQTSSLIWICSANREGSEVTVIDANNPGDVLENFHVCSSHLLCIASIPGAMEDDYEVNGEVIQSDNSAVHSAQLFTDHESSAATQKHVGLITRVHCGPARTEPGSDGDTAEAGASVEGDVTNVPVGTVDHLEMEIASIDSSLDQGSSIGRNRRHLVRDIENELVRDGVGGGAVGGNRFVSDEVDKSSSILPTMWLGAQSGSIFVYSAVSNWKRCLHSLRLKDSVLSITHAKGRVFVALADGSVAVFHRDSSGQWHFSDYHVVTLGDTQFSVRCSCVVANKHVWFGYRNTIHILNPKTLQIEESFDAHPRKESQVRQMAWVGDGVWLSIRLDSTLRLYHAYTHEHLQDVDIEPYVSKLLGNSKLGFSFVRISCLMTSCNRLWIGTGNGVILSVPLSETNDPGILTSLIACNSNRQAVTSSGCGRPGGVVRVYSGAKTDSVFPSSFIPYCSIAQAQLSFHGHKDAVKFFVTVPGLPSKGVSGVGAAAAASGSAKEKLTSDTSADEFKNLSKNLLVVSGGEGYVDFRLGELDDVSSGSDEKGTDMALSKGERSHLIVWQVFMSA